MEKILGVIGGLGPATTSEFYSKISYDCQQQGGEHRPHILISSVPMPYEAERAIILENKNTVTEMLKCEARRLENAGATFIVMPCNTLHCDAEAIRSTISVKMLSIVDETVAHIKRNNFKRVGVLATLATVKREVYTNIFRENNIDFVTPSADEQAKLNSIIVNLVEGKMLDSDRAIVNDVITNLKNQGADSIALACTDLQLLRPTRDDIEIFDTMAILADACVRELS